MSETDCACVCVICWQSFGIYLLCPPFVVLLLLSAVHVVSSFLAGVFSQSKSERERGREREREGEWMLLTVCGSFD